MIALAVATLLLVVLAWGGYPLALGALARRRPRRPAPTPGHARVSVVIATRDDPSRMRARIDNLLASEFPRDQLEIVVGVDCTSEWTPTEYTAVLGDDAVVVAGDAPGGKATTLNRAVEAASHELLVFADSGQTFAPDALTILTRALQAPGVGAVSGGYETKQRGGVADMLWRFEQFIRRGEASVHSIVAVTGAIYGMRKSLWTPLRPHLICDDLFVPLNVVFQGHRVDYCEDALATDPRHFTRTQDFRRKVRTLTGMLQLCAWMPRVLNPFRNPVWLQFVCHKLLRLATPFLLLLGMAALLPLAWPWVAPTLPFVALSAVVLIGGLALLQPRLLGTLTREAGWALMLLMAPINATLRAVRGQWDWS